MNETRLNKITGDVLIVDDDVHVLTTISELLSAVGCEVHVARSGQDALDSVEKDPPDLVLLDINMPDMDGYEVCRWLRTQEASRDIPVLFLSVMAETEDIVKAFSSGGSDYIPKPFNGKELITRVQTHLANNRLKQILRDKNKQLQGEIEERIRVEKELRASETRLGTMIENLPFDFFLIDDKGQYVMQNATCRRNWGDVVGKRPDEVSPDKETLTLWESNNRRAFNGETVREEVVLPSPQGDRYIYNIIAPIMDQEMVKGIMGFNIDVTELRWTEERLEQTKDAMGKMAKLVSDSPNPVLRISKHGILLYANKASGPILETWEAQVGQPCPQPFADRAKEVYAAGRASQMKMDCVGGSVFLMTLSPDLEEGYLNLYGTAAGVRSGK